MFTCDGFSLEKTATNAENAKYFELVDIILAKIIALNDKYDQMEELTLNNVSKRTYSDKTIVSLYYYDKEARLVKSKNYLILRAAFVVYNSEKKASKVNVDELDAWNAGSRIGRMVILYSVSGNESKNIKEDIKNIISAVKPRELIK